ncbi:MAG: hypothetical protein RBT59_02310 [Arcobacteraceae bacterium]|jgi:hypothetical protein|nr:hypothetical protein [Arcobacteraceae bacterium]
MKKDLVEFMEQNKPKNPLGLFKDEIAALKERCYSSAQVKQFLKECRGVTVSVSTINRYYKDEILEEKRRTLKIEAPTQQEKEKEVIPSGRDFFIKHALGNKE